MKKEKTQREKIKEDMKAIVGSYLNEFLTLQTLKEMERLIDGYFEK